MQRPRVMLLCKAVAGSDLVDFLAKELIFGEIKVHCDRVVAVTNAIAGVVLDDVSLPIMTLRKT